MTTNRTRRIPADAAEVARFSCIRNRDIDRFLVHVHPDKRG